MSNDKDRKVSGAIGTGDNPVDVYAEGELDQSLNNLLEGDMTAYVGEFHLQTPEGKFLFQAEDGQVVITYDGESDD